MPPVVEKHCIEDMNNFNSVCNVYKKYFFL
jgi:hypothetical protein